MKAHKLTIEQSKEFIFGGKAIFTIKNEQNGHRFTYKLSVKKTVDPNNPIYFVSALRGNDNENSYTFIGTIFNKATFVHGKKSPFKIDAPSVKAFTWFFKHFMAGTLPEFISIFHEGCCARCGRTLTVPESILSGFGPECVKLRSKDLKLKERQLKIG